MYYNKGWGVMKNTFKLLFIFMGGLTALIVIALSGFLIIEKNKTYYIYDVRIVQPISSLDGYVYFKDDFDEEKNETSKLVSIKNKTVYMKSVADNKFPIAIYASTSNNTREIKVVSTDTSVAKIVVENEKLYVKYLKEGETTIYTEVGGVKDSFILKVLDRVPSEFEVYDNAYYGANYVDLFPNSIVGYADNKEYRYGYKLGDITGSEDISKIDGDLLRVDESNLDTDIFSSVKVDSSKHQLVVKCKTPTGNRLENINTSVILQSYTYDKNGNEIIHGNYIVSVYVILRIPEYMQLEVSSNPDFSEKVVYTSSLTTEHSREEILANPLLLDEFLSAQKDVKYLSARGEKAAYEVFFTKKVTKLYLRFRFVYTNGDVEYITNGENGDIVFDDDARRVISPMDNYYILNLTTDNYFVKSGNTYNDYNISVSLENYTFSFDFVFKYLEQTEDNARDYLYSYDADTGIYTYKYWDNRAKFTNEICDANGNVIGFGV